MLQIDFHVFPLYVCVAYLCHISALIMGVSLQATTLRSLPQSKAD